MHDDRLRFFVDRDADGRWFRVPEPRRAEWAAWLAAPTDTVPAFAVSVDDPHAPPRADDLLPQEPEPEAASPDEAP